MNVLEDFHNNPSDDATTEELLEACRAWINAVFESAGSNGAPPLYMKTRQRVEKATLEHLRRNTLQLIRDPEALKAKKEAQKRSNRSLEDVWIISEGVLTKPKDLESLDEFKRFVSTLTSFYMMKLCDRDKEANERRFAAEYFIGCMIPNLDARIEAAGRGNPSGQGSRRQGQSSSATVHAIEHLWSDRPITSFLAEDFTSCSDAINYLMAGARNAAIDAYRRDKPVSHLEETSGSTELREYRQHRTFEIANCRVAHPLIEAGRYEFGRQLLDELWPYAVEVARKFPNSRGESLLLWMMLGGISHKKVDRKRHSLAPYLVQRELIEAVLSRFGRFAIDRTYKSGIEQVGYALKKGYQERIAKLLEKWISEIDQLTPANRMAFIRRLEDERFGFHVFEAHGIQTGRMIRDGLIELKKRLTRMDNDKESAQEVVRQFLAVRPSVSRDDSRIPATTRFICDSISQSSEGEPRKKQWLKVMDSLGSNKE